MTELAAALRAIVGDTGVLDAPADLEAYRGDFACRSASADIVVARPRTTEEVVALVRYCAALKIAIVPRGGGTGLSGGATPTDGPRCVVLSFERMRAVRSVDPVGDAIVVEAGCSLAEAREVAARHGRLLALEHGGAGSSQIGGNLATNAGGNTVLRYGMARDQVLGLEVVLADGRVLSRLAPLRKSNAGYDLKQLFIGSEGTLGLITAATLRLRPAAAVRGTACLAVASPAAALRVLADARSALGEAITACELISGAAAELQAGHLGRPLASVLRGAPWLILLEADSASRHFDIDGALTALIESLLEAGLVSDGTVASSEAQRADLWAMREGVAIAMIETPGTLKSDTAVPVAAVPYFIEQASAAVAGLVPDCLPVPFGHLGDGNIHFNVVKPAGMEADAFAARWPDLADAIAAVSLACGGTVSAEHGIGLTKRAALRTMLTPDEIDVMRALKTCLDPDGRLNPGKILPAPADEN